MFLGSASINVRISFVKTLQNRLQFFNVRVTFKSTEAKTEAVARRCFVKKVFLEFLQNSQENIFARVSFFNEIAVF